MHPSRGSEYPDHRGMAKTEIPVKWSRNRLVVLLEAQQAVFHRRERCEIIGGEGLALQDRKVDFNLIEPTGVHWPVHQYQGGMLLLQTDDRPLAPMRRAVVNDPEHPAGLVIGGLRHDLLHQAVKRFDARFRLATTEEFGTLNIECSEVGPRPTSFVLMFHLHGRSGSRGVSGVLATACLDTGLLVGRKHELIAAKGLAVPLPLVEIQDTPRLGGEIRIAREDPTAMLPGADGVFVEPAPDGATRQAGHQSSLAGIAGQFPAAPTRQGAVLAGGKFTG